MYSDMAVGSSMEPFAAVDPWESLPPSSRPAIALGVVPQPPHPSSVPGVWVTPILCSGPRPIVAAYPYIGICLYLLHVTACKQRKCHGIFASYLPSDSPHSPFESEWNKK